MNHFLNDSCNKAAKITNYRIFLGDEGVDAFIGSGAVDQYVKENIDHYSLAPKIVPLLSEGLFGWISQESLPIPNIVSN